jgi:hypothetical protein
MKPYLTSILAITMTSCASRRSLTDYETKEASYHSAKQGHPVPADESHQIRHPDFIKSYHVGRTPNEDGSIMHEAHQVYERGQSSRWNLHGDPLKSNGPVVGLVDGAKVAPISNREIEAEKHRQRDLSAELLAAQQALQKIRQDAEAKLSGTEQELLRFMRRGTDETVPAPSTNEPTDHDEKTPDFADLRAWGKENADDPNK